MSDRFATLLTAAATPGAAPALILDCASYAQRVLLQNRDVPWHDATAYSNHLSQAQALLKPPVALVPLDRLFEHELERNAPLLEAMGARSRVGFAAKTLLADERVRRLASDIVATVVKTQREPVVLHLPSPLALLAVTTLAVDSEAALDFDADNAENIAIYYADWLRAFAEWNIAGIIFDERGGGDMQAGSYQPVNGLAQHYRWLIGRRSEATVRFLQPGVEVPVLDASVWDGDRPATLSTEVGGGDVAVSGVVLAEIPADAVPEDVLARLAELRAA